MKISVIIPVFNAEKYLRRCIDTVVRALDGVKGEIIVVNNNSTDGSPQIITEYQQKYPKMLHAMNCKTWGAAAVRNLGVGKARGEYIWFVDADDEITKDAAKKLLAAARKQKADIVMMGATKIWADGHTQYLKALDPTDKMLKNRFIRSGLGPWQVIIRRQWYLENKFAFREGIIHEDMEMMPALILYTDKYAAVDEPLYKYYENPGSVLHKAEWNPHFLDIFPALSGVYDRFREAGALQEYHDDLEWFFIWNLLLDSAKDFAKAPEGRVGFEKSRKMLGQYFPNWRKNRIMKGTTLRTKLRIRLNYRKR